MGAPVFCSLCGSGFKKNDVIDLTLRIELDGSHDYLSVESIALMLVNRLHRKKFHQNVCKPIELVHEKCKREVREVKNNE